MKTLHAVRSAVVGVVVASSGWALAAGAQLARVAPSAVLDVTPPSVAQITVSGSLNLDQPLQRVSITLNASDDVSGLSGAWLTFKSPSGVSQTRAQLDLSALGPVAKGVRLSVGMGGAEPGAAVAPWAEAGRWSLVEVVLNDMAGNTRVYGASEIAASGWATQFSVVNPHVDIRPPVLGSGQILTPVLSLSDRIPGTSLPPMVRVSLEVADKGNTAISGLQQAVLQLCRVGSACAANDTLALRYQGSVVGVERSTVLMSGLMDPVNQSLGDYAISSLTLYDHAGQNTWMATKAQGGKTNFLKYFPSVTVTVLP